MHAGRDAEHMQYACRSCTDKKPNLVRVGRASDRALALRRGAGWPTHGGWAGVNVKWMRETDGVASVTLLCRVVIVREG